MTGPAIRLDDLTVAYGGHPAVHHLSGSFRPGSLTAIAGANGAGKSTLVKAIMGDLRPAGGAVLFDDLDRSAIGYLPQAAEIERRFPIDVLDTVLLGAWRRCGAFGGVSRALRAAAERALAAVRLDGFGKRPIGDLSAGQFQRVLFARLMLQDAPVILLDEPFTAVDARTTADLLAIVGRWHEEGRTVIAVLHDHGQIRRHFPETLLLARQCVAWGATGEAMSPASLDRANALAERWLEDAPVCRPAVEDAA
ncbi:ATPase component of Mn/Zn ABC-type transporter [uncultured Pleomorphomonas sp.]|uniref:ATPase component of Mn/Zn ABC-type transporter n=1 Tax=uncultured Pleomorphomonas sp. TaxID=442121 RepID=A0A212L328_9HYPH|nr:ABC transporter ATP-binding protein [uncultured Pleomorphomonas sp.]SCM71759.1 ATPase component of Mn/Zn ABC-type transporter [uncultured Pleomorphomonas sp.]